MSEQVNFRLTAQDLASPALGNVQKSLRRTRQESELAAVAGRRFGESLGGSSHSRIIQQAGMQISDFAVQVAGGQSAILAFTQNAPQFIQNFGAMGGVMAAAVTIIGTVAFGLSRAATAIKSFDDQVKLTNESVSEYISLLREANNAQGGDIYKGIEEAALGSSAVLADMIAIQKTRAYESVVMMNASLVDSVKGASWLKTEMQDMGRLIGATTGEIVSANLGGRLGADVNAFASALDNLGNARGIQDQYDAAMHLRDMFIDLAGPVDAMNTEQQDFVMRLAETIQKLELLGAVARAPGENLAEGYNKGFLAVQRAHRAILEQQATEEQAQARTQARSINAYQQYAALRLQGERIRAEAEAAAQARSISAYQQYAALRLQGERMQAEAEAATTHARMVGIQQSHQMIAAQNAANQQLLLTMQQEAQLAQMITRYGENSWRVAIARVSAERAAYQATLATMNATAGVKAQMLAAWDAARGLLGTVARIESAIQPAIAAAQRLVATLGGAIGQLGQIANMLPGASGVTSVLERLGGVLGNTVPRAATSTANGLSEVTDNLGALWDMASSGGSFNEMNNLLNSFKPDESGGGGGALDNIMTKDGKNNWLQSIDQIKNGLKGFSDTIADAIVNSKNLADVFAASLKKMAANLISSGLQTLMQKVLGPLFGSMGGGGFGNIGKALMGGLFPGFGGGGGLKSFDGGGSTGWGARVGGLDNKGGRLAVLHPQETVVDHTGGSSGMGGGAIRVYVDDDMRLRAVFEQNVNAKMQSMNKNMPGRVRQINNDPYRGY